MTGNTISKSLLTIGNVIKNVASDDTDALKLEPDIISSGKITRLMSKFIIAPNVIVDENLKYMDEKYFKDLIKTEIVTFTAIVTQAFRVMAEIYGVSPHMIVDKMSGRHKDLHGDLTRIKDLVGGIESFDYVGDLLQSGEGMLPALENINNNEIHNIADETKVSNNSYIQKDVASFINVFEIQLQFENDKGEDRAVVIPVIIYPNIIFTNADSLVSNMLDSDSGKTAFDRWHDYRAGVISLSDLIFATDLVKKYKHRKITNANDIATYLNVIDKTTTVKDILHNRKHFYRNYNIYIFDINKLAKIERKLKGTIYKERYKDKLTEVLNAFSVSLVDTEKEEVMIFIDDIPGFSALNFNMLKKEKDNDMKDVIKELMNNRQPF